MIYLDETILNEIIPTNKEVLEAAGMDVEPLNMAADKAKEVIISEKAKFKWRNELVEGKFKLSCLELHLLAALSAHINKNAADFEWLCVSVNDLGNLLGIDNNNRFEDLEEVIERLHKRILSFESVEKTRSGAPKRKVTTSWFTSILYDYEHSYIVFKFAAELKPLFLEVKKAYVEMPLEKLLPIKGTHSNRLFLMVEEWLGKDKRLKKKLNLKNNKPVITIVSIEDIKEQLGLETNYKKWKDFKINVLDPSVEEIKSALGEDSYFAYEPIKTGRKYTHLKFIIKRMETHESKAVSVDSPSPMKLNVEQQSVFDEMLRLGLRKKEAEDFIKDKPLEDIKISIEIVKKYDEAGKVKTLGGFLRTAIAEGYGVAEAKAAAQEAAAAAAKEADKLACMTPEQKADYVSHQDMLKQAAELAAEGEKPKAPAGEVNTEEQTSKAKELMKILKAEHMRAEAEKGKSKKINQ